MPLARITTSKASSPEIGQSLLAALSRLVAERLGKPEEYVMTCLVHAPMTFAGSGQPCALLELKSIGRFQPQQTRELSAALCALLAEHLAIPSSRIYIEFSDVTGYLWGHDGETFA
jgi:phenylpyruvate tautomerase